MADTNNGVPWSKIALGVLSFLLTALLAVFGFVLSELMDLKGDIGDLKGHMGDLQVQEAQRYGEIREQLGRQQVTVKTLSTKIDSITVTRVREEIEP
jgi:hypothetical protein